MYHNFSNDYNKLNPLQTFEQRYSENSNVYSSEKTFKRIMKLQTKLAFLLEIPFEKFVERIEIAHSGWSVRQLALYEISRFDYAKLTKCGVACKDEIFKPLHGNPV